MSERLKETGCKTRRLSLRWFESKSRSHFLIYAGIAQLVEHRPSKPRVASSSLVSRFFAHVAQLVEHTLGKGEVTGSSPVMGSSV